MYFSPAADASSGDELHGANLASMTTMSYSLSVLVSNITHCHIGIISAQHCYIMLLLCWTYGLRVMNTNDTATLIRQQLVLMSCTTAAARYVW